MIDCVSVPTSHHFSTNLLRKQHRLRHAEVVLRFGWRDVYEFNDLEFDRYDTIATEYFVSRDEAGEVVGVIRSNPTTIPYMLEEYFPFLVHGLLPKASFIYEASRIVLDRDKLPSPEQRAIVVDKLLVALMERGRQRELSEYIGFMTPKIWKSTFIRIGWQPEWLGPEIGLPRSRYTVRAGRVPVTRSLHERVKVSTGLTGDTILNFGRRPTSRNVD